MLNLHQIATMNRFRLEDRCRALSQSVFLGGHSALCRVLGRYKFYIDTNDHGFGAHVLLDGFWEMWLTQFMARFVKPGMIVADIGANYGYYSLLLADLVGPEGRVHSFEPNPVAASFLTNSVMLNGFASRTQIHRLALGATDGEEVSLFVPHDEPKNASVVPLGTQVHHIPGILHTVSTQRLDSLLPEDGRLDFVKIDAEGAEQNIVEGMMETIRRARPSIVLEFNAARYDDPSSFLSKISEPYGALHHIDYSGDMVPVASDRVVTENFGEDWLLFFGNTEIALPQPSEPQEPPEPVES
jgi:FkbM family methyltransferase